MCKHWECACYSPATESCDYILIFGKSRGCPPTDDWKEYRTSSKGFPASKKRYVDLAAVARMEKAYDPNSITFKMAKKARVSINLYQSWVKKAHPEFPNLNTHEFKW